MIKITDVSAPLQYSGETLKKLAAKKLGCDKDELLSVKIAKKSVDARKKPDVRFNLTLEVSARNEEKLLRRCSDRSVGKAAPFVMSVRRCRTLGYRPVVVGFGPAGFFAALTLAKAGAKPIVLERGADVDARTAAVKTFWGGGRLDPDTNVQFGEGGAGTFSDGKLNTGTKDPRIAEVFHELVRFGAPQEILVDAKPHIGTDRLADTVKAIRREIISLGGEVVFGAKVTGFESADGEICAVRYEKGGEAFELSTRSVILAVGHSARDTFALLHDFGVRMCRKSFAVGMRIEHLQSELNRSMYGEAAKNGALPPADYKLVAHLPNGRTLYSFCMCPGGQVVAAASEPGMVVTNGMSRFARDGANANSALLVNVNPEDFDGEDVLAGVELQRRIERAAFSAGGGNYFAPVSLAGDFLDGKLSTDFGRVKPSYAPGTVFARPEQYLPTFVTESVRLGLPQFARKIACFGDREAVLTGAETRSSSPVRIERGENLQSLSLRGLYPCGEGAGYAGGIVSAAVDGIRCAEAICGLV